MKENLPQVNLGKVLNLYGLTVGIPREYHCPGLCPQVLQAWSNIADLLQEAGATVKPVTMPIVLLLMYVVNPTLCGMRNVCIGRQF